MPKQQLPPGSCRLKNVPDTKNFKTNLRSITTYSLVRKNKKSKTVEFSSNVSGRTYEKSWDLLVYIVEE